jgi:two-component system NarL family response regulator
MTHAGVANQPSNRYTILVAEDDQELQELYHLLLADEYDTLRAYNGQEAVDLYCSERPDLILMDIKMPIMTGSEAIERIFAIDPKARILAVTAYRFGADELGVPVLRKGFSVAEFMGRVHATLHT